MNNIDPQTEILRDISLTLHELINWARIIGRDKVKETLEKVLDTEQKRLVYEFCDGEKGVKDIEKLTGVNIRYISEWSQEWERIGIVEAGTKVKGRRRKLFDLAVFGIATQKQGSSMEE